MEASRAAAIQDSSLHQSADQRPVDQPVDSAQLSTSLRYNESGDQIYIPGRGWMDAAELWDLYFNDLSQLPADLDFSALHSLRELYEQHKPTGDGDDAVPDLNREAG